jgi:hypothetical protein
MKITNADICIDAGKLTVNGKQITGLFDRANNEPLIQSQRSATASLPAEDLTPGHVVPAVVLTVSRAS